MRRRAWPAVVALGLVTSMLAGTGVGLAAEEEEGVGNNLSTPVIFAEGYGLGGTAVDPADITSTGLPGLLKPVCGGVESWVAGSNQVDFPMNGDLYQLEIDGTIFAESVGNSTAAPGKYFLEPYSLVPLAGGDAVDFGHETCWEADWADGSAIDTVDVNFLDVGDSLVRVQRRESNNPIRVEFTLYQSTETAGTFQDGTLLSGYPMSRLWPPAIEEGKPPSAGGGMSQEVWATADVGGEGEFLPAELASVYTQNARLTIDKLTWAVIPDSFVDPSMDGYPSGIIPDTFDGGYDKWVESVEYDGVVGGGEGEGVFSSEVNQSGRVLMGYNWGLGDPIESGWYRITLSIDGSANGIDANAAITGVDPADQSLEEEVDTHELELLAQEDASKAFFPPTLVEGADGNYVYVDVYIADSPEAGKGKMTGKVTTTGGTALAGKDVTIYHPNGDPAALAVTGADGSFQTDMAAGIYNAGVVDSKGQYWDEFYDDRGTLADADDIVLTDGGMAYLEIALSKIGVEPPPSVDEDDDDDDKVAPGHFKDVYWDNTFYADIEWMWAAGITKGCNPPDNDEFCPVRAVTRAQMASFFVRALGLTDGGDVDRFVDDDGSTHETDINRLAASGITKGCNPSTGNDRFCPRDSVLREQMAAFFHRASPWWE